jgi:hypothetical protein
MLYELVIVVITLQAVKLPGARNAQFLFYVQCVLNGLLQRIRDLSLRT